MLGTPLSALSVLSALSALSGPAPDTSYLYRVMMLRTAPNQVQAVVDLYQKRFPAFDATDGRPWLLRHTHGGQWDLMIVFPMGSWASFYTPEASIRRAEAIAGGLTAVQFDSAVDARAAWREDLFVVGPPPAEVAARLDAGEFYHVDMFVALPGKRAELVHERELDNAYQAALRRPQSLLFTRVAGAAWDVLALAVYRDMDQFSASINIPPARQDSAARAAGFTSFSVMGSSLKALISDHTETLAGAIKP